MQTGLRDAPNGRHGDDRSAEVKVLRATCRRQAWAIGTLTRVVRNLRDGARALEAENTELRRAGGVRRLGADTEQRPQGSVEVRLALDVGAPGAARIVVTQVLGERVAAPVLERAKLVMSELVSNSVRHRGPSADAAVTVRVRLLDGGLWLEVEDPGRNGIVAPHGADPRALGGFGLHIVQALSERWGSERARAGRTRVWAQLADTAVYADQAFGERDEATRPDAARAGTTEGELRRPGRRAARVGRSAAVHVVPRPRTATWGVYVDSVADPLSEHTSETEAEAAARAHALTSGGEAIVVHDRYHRTHVRLAPAH
jgi:anti-sigma regulatory factor (Ser/Thr protein kinase)